LTIDHFFVACGNRHASRGVCVLSCDIYSSTPGNSSGLILIGPIHHMTRVNKANCWFSVMSDESLTETEMPCIVQATEAKWLKVLMV